MLKQYSMPILAVLIALAVYFGYVDVPDAVEKSAGSMCKLTAMRNAPVMSEDQLHKYITEQCNT
jgi:hypothetical protein